MNEASDLTNAIKELTAQLKGGGGKSGDAFSTGLVQGMTEAAVSANVMNRAVNVMNRAVTRLAVVFEQGVANVAGFVREIALGTQSVAMAMDTLSKGYAEGAQDNINYVKSLDGVGQQHKRSIFSMDKFNGMVNKAAASLTLLATLGLAETVEGNKLTWAFRNLTYQLADLLRGPIRFLTRELNGLAYVIRHVNNSSMGNAVGWGLGGLIGYAALARLGLRVPGPLMAAGATAVGVDALNHAGFSYDIEKKTQKFLGLGDADENQIRWQLEQDYRKEHPVPGGEQHWWGKSRGTKDEEETWTANRDAWVEAEWQKKKEASSPETLKKEAQEIRLPDTKKGEDEHVKPLYQTSFGALTSLWENMNKMATENPGLDAQEKTASYTQYIYEWLTEGGWHTPNFVPQSLQPKAG